MRQIKASEIKAGMEVEWSRHGVLHRLTPSNVVTLRSDSSVFRPNGYGITGYSLSTQEGGLQWVGANQEVTVLSEPAPPQPEEPTEFGARVTVGGEKFLRAQHPISVPVPWLSESDGTWRNWAVILAMGPVTVIPDQGWTVPDTPEVPERIEAWPEDDTALRDHAWRGHYGNIWTWFGPGAKWEGRSFAGSNIGLHSRPTDAPFTRVIDA